MKIITSAILLGLCFVTFGSFSQTSSIENKPITRKPTFFRLSPPLKEMIENSKGKYIKPREKKQKENYFKPLNNGNSSFDRLSTKFQSLKITSGNLTELSDFDGVSNIDGVSPPDTQGDVSPNYYMQCVNLHTAIYDKSGNVVQSPFPTSNFWSGSGFDDRNDGDPVILWDESAQRWFVTQFYVPSSGNQYLLIAISQTNDPTGSYYQYAYQYDYMPDYPKWGIWPDGYYMGAHAFDQDDNYAFKGNYLTAFERDKLLVGDGSALAVTFLKNAASIFPVDADVFPTLNGEPCPFINDERTYTTGNNEVYIYNFHVDWTNTDNSTFTDANTISVADYDLFSSDSGQVPQQGVSQKLDLLHSRIMYRPYFRQFPDHKSLLMTRTIKDGSVSAIRWYEFRDTGNSWYLYQQGTVNPGDGLWRWMPSISMNANGDIALGYSVSGESDYPSIRGIARFENDPIGVMTTNEQVFQTSSNSQDGISRWGDYSMVSIDPSDDETFWFTSEYTTGDWDWKTRITHFQLPTKCTPPDIQASSLTFSNITDNQLDLSWVRGNGDKVLVLVKKGDAVNVNPANYKSYNPDTVYAKGDDLGNFNYVIYKGTGASTTITDLEPGINYHFAIYEYFDANNCYNIEGLVGDVLTTGTTCNYCLSSGDINYNFSVNNVIFNTINKASAKDEDATKTYSDFTNISTDLIRDKSYNLTVQVSTNGDNPDKTKVWIDWNHNCDFTDAGEEYDLGDAQNVANGATSNSPLSITVPSNASLGKTTMRVSTKYYSYPTSCETDFYGEVEDYTLYIKNKVCPSSGNTDYDTSITNVSFNTIDKSSGKTGYSDYTNTSTTVFTDNTYDLNVKVNTDGDYESYTKVWIDWNNNTDFSDTGEEYDLGTAQNVTDDLTSLSPLNITIPLDIPLGPITMRVSTKFNAYATSCETGFDGEVEDYTLIISNCNGTTTWNGSSWDNGIPNKNTSAIIDGNYDTGSGNFECCSLTINSEKTVTIQSGDYILAKGYLENSGTLEIMDTGAFVQRSNKGTISGSGHFIVHRISPSYNDYDFLYWSTPVNNETIGSTFAESPSDYIYKYNTSAFLDLYSGDYPQTSGSSDSFDDNGNDWEHSNSNDKMIQGKGYIALGKDSEIPFDFDNIESNPGQEVIFNDGKLNTGIISIPVYKDKYNTDGLSGADANHKNANLIGNPYPSAIDVVKLQLENTPILEGSYYIWTHDTPVADNSGPSDYDVTVDDFATLSVDSNGIFSDAASGSGTHASQYIASCQGFFANVTDNGAVSFKNNMRKIDENNHFFRLGKINIDRLWLNLTNTSGTFRQVFIGFHDLATDMYQPGQDVLRMTNGDSTDFYSVIPNNSERYVIQNLDTFNIHKKVALGIEISEAGTYNISIEKMEGVFNRGQNVFLEDLVTGTIHNLSESSYNFTSDVIDNNNRFILRFTSENLSISDTEASADIIIYPNPSSNIFNIYIPYNNKSDVKITVFDIRGNYIKTSHSTTIDMTGFSKGIYFANITINNKTIVKKIILK